MLSVNIKLLKSRLFFTDNWNGKQRPGQILQCTWQVSFSNVYHRICSVCILWHVLVISHGFAMYDQFIKVTSFELLRPILSWWFVSCASKAETYIHFILQWEVKGSLGSFNIRCWVVLDTDYIYILHDYILLCHLNAWMYVKWVVSLSVYALFFFIWKKNTELHFGSFDCQYLNLILLVIWH